MGAPGIEATEDLSAYLERVRDVEARLLADVPAALAEIFGWSDVRMALRYTHATDESKRRAVENLAKPIGPSDESVTNEKGRVAALP